MEKEVNEIIENVFSIMIDSLSSEEAQEMMDFDEFKKLNQSERIKYYSLVFFRPMKPETLQKIIDLSNGDCKSLFDFSENFTTIMEKCGSEIEDIIVDLEYPDHIFEKIILIDAVDHLEDGGIIISDETKDRITNFINETKRRRLMMVISTCLQPERVDFDDLSEPGHDLTARDTVRIEDLFIDIDEADVDSFREMWLGEHLSYKTKEVFIDTLKEKSIPLDSIHKDILNLIVTDDDLGIRKRAQEKLLNQDN